MPEQERSIRDREEELFDEPQEGAGAEPPVKPFPIYLRETPATPISPLVKVILWIVGIAVLLLLCAALWRTQRSPRLPSRGATKAAIINVTARLPLMASAMGQPAQFAGGFDAEPDPISGAAADRASES